MHGSEMRVRGRTRCLVSVILAFVISLPVLSATIGGTTITLQSHKYYKHWDLTRFVYRIAAPLHEIPSYWILGAGECIGDDLIDQAASTEYVRTSLPLAGLKYDINSKNQKCYLWLRGQWDIASTDVAVVFERHGGEEDVVLNAVLEGPACDGSSLSVVVSSGLEVEFPQILSAGTFGASSPTQLEVSSTSSRWHLDYGLTFEIPEQAERSVVGRIFRVTIQPFTPVAGTTAVDVSYALSITDEDFSGLPQGAYVIGITYTLTADQ
jgi:hypothetical protein